MSLAAFLLLPGLMLVMVNATVFAADRLTAALENSQAYNSVSAHEAGAYGF
jgi:hypothetical protein